MYGQQRKHENSINQSHPLIQRCKKSGKNKLVTFTSFKLKAGALSAFVPRLVKADAGNNYVYERANIHPA